MTKPTPKKKSVKKSPKASASKSKQIKSKDLLECEKHFHDNAISNADLLWKCDDVSGDNLQWFGDIDNILCYEKGEFPRTIIGHMESIHPDDHDSFITSIENALSSGNDLHTTYRIRCKDGTYRQWEEHGKAVGFKNGKPVKWVGTIIDITERKQAGEILANNKKRFLTMLEKFKSLDKLKHEAAFSSILTENSIMKSVFHYIETIAESSEPIFILGETGVGKELISEAIYNVSNVKGKFVTVNVAGLDDTMFSDTLFGHKKGAFTGADKDRKGLILKASEGTLLLD